MTPNIPDRVAKLEITLQEVDGAVFGNWDIKGLKRLPGIAEQLQQIRLSLAILSVMSVLSLASSLGFPLKDVVPTLAKLAVALIGK